MIIKSPSSKAIFGIRRPSPQPWPAGWLLWRSGLSEMTIAIKYLLFAMLASLANIATQYASLSVYSGLYGLYMAMCCGSLTGLVVKYLLDKKYIFYFEGQSRREDVQKFIRYSLMGVVTTLIFWGCELSFDALFHFEAAKYVGALLGLLIGYIIKYNLDKRFVFQVQAPE
jgi:putative flippase GtrA